MNRRRAKWPCWKLLTATTSQTLKLPKKSPCQVPKKFASMSTWILRTIQWREQCGAMDHHIPKWKDSWSYEWSLPTNVTNISNMIVREEMAGDFPRSISLPYEYLRGGWMGMERPPRTSPARFARMLDMFGWIFQVRNRLFSCFLVMVFWWCSPLTYDWTIITLWLRVLVLRHLRESMSAIKQYPAIICNNYVQLVV